MYSASYNYSTPECRYVVPEQLVVKGKGQVQFATVFLENHYKGWPRADASHAAEASACTNGGGELTEHDNGQVQCKTTKTVYPIGTEEMVMSFEHTYEFPVGKFGLDALRGSSTLSRTTADDHPEISTALESSVNMSAFGLPPRVIAPGGSVSLTLKEWLMAAGTSLDDLNDLANPDALGREGDGPGGSRLPFNRLTGLVVSVQIRYSNGEPTVQKQPHIWANITAQKQFLAWSGPGSEKIHVIYPSGEPGSQTYEYIDRYSQGVVFDFQPTGRVFIFDPQYLLNVIIAGLVLLGLAGSVTDTVAFYMLPNGHSSVLEAHRRVRVTKKQGFAELGIRMANAARAFSESFDPDNNKLVEAEDIVRVLAKIASEDLKYKRKNPQTGKTEMVPFDCEKAHAVAIAVLMDQSEDEAHANSFTFEDYMRTQDNGTVPFPVFLEKCIIPEDSKWTPTAEERKRCEEAWTEGLRSVGSKSEEKNTRRGPQLKSSSRTTTNVTDVSVTVETPEEVLEK
jgi:hypothetical protein